MLRREQWVLVILSRAVLLLGLRVSLKEDSTIIPMSWEGTKSDAVVFNAFGDQYRLKLVPDKIKRVPDVTLYTSRQGVIGAHELKEKPLEVYEDGDTLVAVRKRRTRRGWVPQMKKNRDMPDEEVKDGLISTRSGQFYVRSRPNMMFHSSLGHYVSRRTPHTFYNDYYRVKDQIDDVISRRRRSRTNIRAVVDLLVVTDYAIYRKAMEEYDQNEAMALSEIRKYYKILIAMVDLRYSKINDPTLSIRVRLLGIFVAQDPLGSPWSEEHVTRVEDTDTLEPGVALEKFHDWLKKQFADRILPNHDHAMAFTGYTLYNFKTQTNTAGMAYIGTICKVSDGYSASVIEEFGAFANVGTVTHELGHSLGARHDGSGENTDCLMENNYVMTPQNLGGENIKNFFSFSRCTLRDFRRKLSMEQADCLFDSQPKQYKGKLPGQILGAERQCSQLFGEGSGVCPMKEVNKNICLRLWCGKPGEEGSCVTSPSLAAVYGTPCDEGKICIHGNCVAEENAKGTIETVQECPNGDRHQGYCYRVLLIRPQACARPEIATYCCATCRRVTRGR